MDWKKLNEQLQGFDYTYPMSDDHRVWVNGEKHYNEVQEEIDKALKVDKKRTQRLVNKHKQKYGIQFKTNEVN